MAAKYQVAVRNCPYRAVHDVSREIIQFLGGESQNIRNKLEAKQEVLVSGLTEREAAKFVEEVRSWGADAAQKIQPEVQKQPQRQPIERPLFQVVLEPGHDLSSKILAQITRCDPGDLGAILQYQKGRRKGRDRNGQKIGPQPPCPVTIWLGRSEALGESIVQQIADAKGDARCLRYL